jgi:hypothetical protein
MRENTDPDTPFAGEGPRGTALAPSASCAPSSRRAEPGAVENYGRMCACTPMRLSSGTATLLE